ncbi:MAG: hypothetical protein V1750_04965 [Acidobacteriota bacterium]
MRRLIGLWYTLASSFLAARLVIDRLLLGVWNVSLELLVQTLAVALAQLAVVALLVRLDAGRSQGAPR